MDVSVLDTFIDRFKYLWQSGQDANLYIDTRAGQAWARLDIRLGHAPGPLLHRQHQAHPRPHGDSPTRRRRRERRAQARQANAADTAAHTAPDSAVEVDDLVPSTLEASVQVTLPHPPITAEAAVQPTVRRDAAKNNEEIEDIVTHHQVTSEPGLRELDDEVCPDVIYERSDLTTLLKNMSRAREEEREKDNNDRRKERAKDKEHFMNMLHSKK